MIDAFASFDVASVAYGSKLQESELKNLVERLRGFLEERGFAAGEVFGSSVDIWAFSIDCNDFEISIGIGPKHCSSNVRWIAQIHLSDPGWFPAIRVKRIAELKRVELEVRDVLFTDLGARNIE